MQEVKISLAEIKLLLQEKKWIDIGNYWKV
jgi:hypothetical protein